MLTNNAQQFKSFLLERNMDLNFIDDNGESVIEIREMLKCGAKIRLVTVFDKDDTNVKIYGFDYIQGINPVKKNYIYEALNNLNSNYTFTKYYYNDIFIYNWFFNHIWKLDRWWRNCKIHESNS